MVIRNSWKECLVFISISLISLGPSLALSAPIHDATKAGDLPKIKKLLSHGADLNKKNSREKTPLHEAMYEDNIEIIEYLLTKGADVNSQTYSGRTPLHLALWSGEIGNAKARLKYGADVNVHDDKGITPLHEAVKYDQRANWGSPLTDLVLSKGASPNSQNKKGETPLHVSVRGPSEVLRPWVQTKTKMSLLDGERKVIKSLVESGASLNIKNDEGLTPILICAKGLNEECVDFLILLGDTRNSLNEALNSHVTRLKNRVALILG